jgi:hypothetical protein
MRLFDKLLLVPVGLMAIGLMACSVSPEVSSTTAVDDSPKTTQTILGTLEIGLNGQRLEFVPFGDAKLQWRWESSSDLDVPAQKLRAINASLTLENGGSRSLRNLTLYALARNGNPGGTAFRSVRAFPTESDSLGAALTDPAVAQSIKPAHAAALVAGAVVTDAGSADFQAFDPNSVTQLEQRSKTLGLITSDEHLLEYGFVARSVPDQSRLLRESACDPENNTACNRAQVMIGLRLPRSFAPAPNPYALEMSFLVAEDPVTRVTRSYEEAMVPAKRAGRVVSALERAKALVTVGQMPRLVFVGPDDAPDPGSPNLSFERLRQVKIGWPLVGLIEP